MIWHEASVVVSGGSVVQWFGHLPRDPGSKTRSGHL